MPLTLYNGGIQLGFLLFLLVFFLMNTTISFVFQSNTKSYKNQDIKRQEFRTSFPWPPIKIYAYPNNSHHADECLNPPEYPGRYQDETGFWFQRMLEPTVHHQILESPVYTNNSEEADFFYVPHYAKMCAGIDDSRWHEIDTYLNSHGHYLQRYSSIDHFIMYSSPNYMDKPADRAIYTDQAPMIGVLDFKCFKMNQKIWTAARSALLPFITLKNENYSKRLSGRDNLVYVAMSTSARGLRHKSASLRQSIQELLKDIPHSNITVIDRHSITDFRSIILQVPNIMGQSDYCIVPPGDAPSSKRFYDAIAALCIPILISDYFMLAFENIPVDYEQALIQIPERGVEDLPQILRMQTPALTEKRREYLKDVKRMMTWGYKDPPKPGEALWMLTWAIYDRHRMIEPYLNNELTGFDDDPPIPFSP